MNYCEKQSQRQKMLDNLGVTASISPECCYNGFIYWVLAPLVASVTSGYYNLAFKFDEATEEEIAVLTFQNPSLVGEQIVHEIPLKDVHGCAGLVFKVFEAMNCEQNEAAETLLKREDAMYSNFMESMRKKLDRPPYSGNKGEAYREGVRAAMSKMHALYLYGEGKK